MSPVRNAPELSNETRVDEEQRWVSRGHSQATLEIRRKLPDLRDGNRESCSCSCSRHCSCSPERYTGALAAAAAAAAAPLPQPLPPPHHLKGSPAELV